MTGVLENGVLLDNWTTNYEFSSMQETQAYMPPIYGIIDTEVLKRDS